MFQTMPRLTLITLVVLGAACGRSDTTPALQATPLTAFGDAPTYAQACTGDSDGTISAVSSYAKRNVHVTVLDTNPLQEAILALADTPQAVAVGADNLGRNVLIVAEVNYETDVTRLTWFVDTDGDALVDAGTETVIETLSNAHVISIAYNRDDHVMYVAEAKNDIVYRYADTSGDHLPDSSTRTTMVAGSGILGQYVGVKALFSASVDSVAMIRVPAVEPARMMAVRKVIDTVTDTNSDGIADTVETARWPDRDIELRTFLEQGDVAVDIIARNDVEYSIVVESSSGSETLATFDGTGTEQTVTLSRALDGNEELVVVRTSDGEEMTRWLIVGPNDTVISHRVIETGPIKEGAAVKFNGVNISGTESVEARLLKGPPDVGDAWMSATITAHAANELTLTMPDVGIDTGDVALVEIRVMEGTAPLFLRIYTVEG